MGEERLRGIGAPIRWPAAQQVIQCAAERIDIAPAVHVVGVHCLFGRDVVEGPEKGAGHREPARPVTLFLVVRFVEAGQPQVENDDPAGCVEEQIGRFDVAVDDAVGVSIFETRRGLENDLDSHEGREGPLSLTTERTSRPSISSMTRKCRPFHSPASATGTRLGCLSRVAVSASR